MVLQPEMQVEVAALVVVVVKDIQPFQEALELQAKVIMVVKDMDIALEMLEAAAVLAVLAVMLMELANPEMAVLVFHLHYQDHQ
jgi:hypothetical protein